MSAKLHKLRKINLTKVGGFLCFHQISVIFFLFLLYKTEGKTIGMEVCYEKNSSVILSFSFVIGLAVPAFAAESITSENKSTEIMPYTVVLDSYGLTKAVKSGNTISAVAFTKGKANATSSYVRIDLYRKANGASSWIYL